MRSFEAYCAVCDANVRITPAPQARHPLADARVECIDRVPACDRETCPLEGAAPEQLADLLEFLPSDARTGRSSSGAASGAEEVLRRARIAAMRRGEDAAG